MVRKKLLCFLCLSLFLFLLIPGCKKKTPTESVVPDLILPVIEYFNASPESMLLGSSSTLSWSTKNATNVTINQGVGTVSVTGTTEVSPSETTTYTLTAINSDGRKSMYCIVEIKNWAVLEYTTIPANPIFEYDALLDETHSTFVAVLTETAGVGGQVEKIIIGPCPEGIPQEFAGGTFDAFGSLEICCDMALPGQLTCFNVNWQGVDDNGYVIDEAIWFTITWTSSRGIVSFLKTVEGTNHHKRIK